MCFVLFFILFLEHRASQESLETAKKAPKTAPGSPQERFQKRVNFLTTSFANFGIQNDHKSGPEIVQKRIQKNDPKLFDSIVFLQRWETGKQWVISTPQR